MTLDEAADKLRMAFEERGWKIGPTKEDGRVLILSVIKYELPKQATAYVRLYDFMARKPHNEWNEFVAEQIQSVELQLFNTFKNFVLSFSKDIQDFDEGVLDPEKGTASITDTVTKNNVKKLFDEAMKLATVDDETPDLIACGHNVFRAFRSNGQILPVKFHQGARVVLCLDVPHNQAVFLNTKRLDSRKHHAVLISQ